MMLNDAPLFALASPDNAMEILPNSPDGLNITVKTDITDNLPVIEVSAGNLHNIVDQAEKTLSQSGRHFQASGLLATVQTCPTSGETAIVPVSQPSLMRDLSRLAAWKRFDKRKDAFVAIDPPEKYVRILFASTDYKHLPILRGIARQPYLRPDFSLVTEAGYDAETARYGVFNAAEYTVPANPTMDNAKSALAVLSEVIEECAFDAECDRAAALAAMLTAATRPSLRTAPAFLINAHVQGSGKSFLARLIASLSTPQSVPATAFTNDSDEMRKLLIALLLKSPAVINFDDMSGDIVPSETLKAVITEAFICGRLLGVSKDVICSTCALILFSGNNIEAIKDMARRVLCIQLDPRCETPTAREFKRPNIEMELQGNRAKYVTAALTIIRAWIVSGRQGVNCTPLASFSEWTELCRKPLIWLGMADPAQRFYEQLKSDPAAELLGRVLLGWKNQFGTSPTLVRDVVIWASQTGRTSDFADALMEAAEKQGTIDPRKLGCWLKKHAGRIFDGMKFIKHGDSRDRVEWKLQIEPSLSVAPVLTVIDQPPAEFSSNETVDPLAALDAMEGF
ncbi:MULTISPECIES: hypothetical protein [Deefgea]|uniref:ATP-binding protein n=1 Tax=Deefgea chitinilytica TaxID=570276 RepID=A0ABS2CBK4_9NEIS|nr:MULTISPECIES: hypothetical protein [Deefgea]MBM5571534.1 hypothetical protein [Deefgea chitinilytica]MBM9888767.1 hypothetical protein [Deefgea sp. CFH1-16]